MVNESAKAKKTIRQTYNNSPVNQSVLSGLKLYRKIRREAPFVVRTAPRSPLCKLNKKVATPGVTVILVHGQHGVHGKDL
jgi:hypothetical protein